MRLFYRSGSLTVLTMCNGADRRVRPVVDGRVGTMPIVTVDLGNHASVLDWDEHADDVSDAGRFVGVFAFDRDPGNDLVANAGGRDGLQLDSGADLGSGGHGGGESDFIAAVVDAHLDVIDGVDLPDKQGDDRQDEVAVGIGPPNGPVSARSGST